MNQKEFEKLSKEKVKELNEGDESAEQAWRDGYIYAQQQVSKMGEYGDMYEYMNKIEDFCDQNLDYFEN